MDRETVDRRSVLARGSGALAGLGLIGMPAIARALQPREGERVLPWADRRAENPVPDVIRNQPEWEDLDSFITPIDRFFGVGHYGWPEIDAADWRLRLGGRVRDPMSLDLAAIRDRPREEVIFTLECAGNHGLPFFDAGIGTARWAGTPLGPLLEEVGLENDAVDVVFFGADSGTEEHHDVEFPEHFARAMSVEDAMRPGILLAYEMNGEDLPARHGYPLRLIAPGWYGVANVKWLDRIEVHPRRYMGRYMAQDYVTLREAERNGTTLWTRNSVGPARLKSVPGRVTVLDGAHRIVGAAWGAPIERVEVRIDDGDWRDAELHRDDDSEHAWTLWSIDWLEASEGEHRVTSRATDTDGNLQPAPDDPIIAGKHTYWESNGQITRSVFIS
jgi:DMSO/TMAO reductase YedYZ molybdopterin-dependent catalytic subunit